MWFIFSEGCVKVVTTISNDGCGVVSEFVHHYFIEPYQYGIVCVGRTFTDHLVRLPTIKRDISLWIRLFEDHPTWPWALSVMRHLWLLWATCFSISPPLKKKHIFLRSNLNLSFQFKNVTPCPITTGLGKQSFQLSYKPFLSTGRQH